jgi:hypothetical protein
MDYKRFISTRPTPELCPKCGTLLLTGHADGFAFRAELDPVNQAGELSAVLDHQDTYELVAGFIKLRTAVEMQARPADRAPVVVQHRCLRTIPIDHRAHHAPDPTWAAINALKLKYQATDCPPPF